MNKVLAYIIGLFLIIMFAGGEYVIRELTLANGDILYHPCRHLFLCIWIYMSYEYDGFEEFLTPCKTYKEAEKIITDHKELKFFRVVKTNP